MKEPRTTLVYKGVEYPFYVTNRGRFDFANAGFKTAGIIAGDFDAQMASIYFNLKDCAKRAGMPFTDTLDQFVDNSDTDIMNVFLRLQDARKREAEAKAEAKAEAEVGK